MEQDITQFNCGSESLIQDPDGFLLTFVSSPELGEICKFNLRGDLVWNGTEVIIGNESKNATELKTIQPMHILSQFVLMRKEISQRCRRF